MGLIYLKDAIIDDFQDDDEEFSSFAGTFCEYDNRHILHMITVILKDGRTIILKTPDFGYYGSPYGIADTSGLLRNILFKVANNEFKDMTIAGFIRFLFELSDGHLKISVSNNEIIRNGFLIKKTTYARLGELFSDNNLFVEDVELLKTIHNDIISYVIKDTPKYSKEPNLNMVKWESLEEFLDI